MKTKYKMIYSFLVLLMMSFLLYCAQVVVKARNDTPEIVKKWMSSGQTTLNVSDLSAWQLQALLAIEDPRFFQHHGIDLNTPGAGITTITQGIVKFLYFHPFKPGFAKLKQSLIARFAFDPLVSKQEQLVLFINYIYLGTVNMYRG